MRKRITSKLSEEKRKKKNQIIIGIVLIGIMLASVLGYSFQFLIGETQNTQTANKVTYNGTQFNSLKTYSGKTLFIYSESPAAETEVRKALTPEVKEIKTIEKQAINCKQNTIVIREGKTNINQDQNCLYITAPQSELLNQTDNFLLRTFGIN